SHRPDQCPQPADQRFGPAYPGSFEVLARFRRPLYTRQRSVAGNGPLLKDGEHHAEIALAKTTPKTTKKLSPLKIVIGLIIVVALFLLFRTGKKEQVAGTVFVVRQGNLPISVTEGGSIEALESQEIRSEIKGYQGTKILSIVEEGYLVTDE